MQNLIKWPNCPFCGNNQMTSSYNSCGTTLYCGDDGCHGRFNFPAFEEEVMAMWKRNRNQNRKKIEQAFKF